jgi:hypothetical protein
MNFKIYDVLSSLIPGFIILMAVLELLNLPFNKEMILPYTAYAFLLGHLINTISGWSEDFYFLTWR